MMVGGVCQCDNEAIMMIATNVRKLSDVLQQLSVPLLPTRHQDSVVNAAVPICMYCSAWTRKRERWWSKRMEKKRVK